LALNSPAGMVRMASSLPNLSTRDNPQSDRGHFTVVINEFRPYRFAIPPRNGNLCPCRAEP
jgi:hypothetical protein